MKPNESKTAEFDIEAWAVEMRDEIIFGTFRETDAIERLAEFREVERLEDLGIGKESAKILAKERRHVKKQLRKKVSGDE